MSESCSICQGKATVAVGSGVRVYACSACSRTWSNVRCVTRGCGRYGMAACRRCMENFCQRHINGKRICGRCQ